MKRQKIAVIGAGIMGLSSAYYLIKKGYDVTLFEKESDIGGMAVCFDFQGTEIERFYHFHCVSDYDYFELLKELNLIDKFHWRSTKMGFWFNGKIQPWGNPIALLKFRGLGILAKIRYGFHAFYSVKKNKYDDLDKIESTSWIKKWVGEEAWSKLWENLFSLKFYEYSNKLSAAWIWSRIRRIGKSRYSIFKEKLGYLEGGSLPLLRALEDNIKNNNGKIYTSYPVCSVNKLDNGKYQILSDAVNDCSNEEFDYIVSTIPLPYIPNIFKFISEREYNMFSKVENIGVVCVIVKLAKPLSDCFWLNINDQSMDIPGIIEYSNLNSCDGQNILYIPYYMPITNSKYNEADEVYCQKIKNYIMTINPSIEAKDFIEIVVSRYRYAQPICYPEYKKYIPDIKMTNENVYIADTSYYYPEDRGVSESIKLSKKITELINVENK
jgi:protoporphyrinogen oxidase